MENLLKYIISRLFQWLIVVVVGITVVFIVPRFTPMDPIQTTLSRVTAYSYIDPDAINRMIETLKDLYGLKGTLFQQYVNFWKHLLLGDLGPSLSLFPTSVMDVIRTSLPWTIGLLAVSTFLSWIIGILLGALAEYFSNRKWSQILGTLIMCIYPVPYYIIALILVLLFAYIIPIFPLVGGAAIGLKPALSWKFITSLIKHGFLPAVSLMIGSVGWIFLSQRSLISRLISSDFIIFAETAALPRKKILSYLIRNSMLPQITDLALQLGSIFSGALITELVFSYPGMGYILYSAILQADFNLIMGISIFSIIGVSTAALVLDVIYPFLDPRIRYK